ncbi:NAD(P)/FAD-dependent oxidoreductase [Stenotrophomonas sp. SAM-B]|uniref:NAD(P)/FAD-dependent oxidoreductase n=1 Tax=Stenotrophomonas sp. SAM-B TaxID=2729141 RepID=UPI00159FCFF5|nr:NAD(P)/FAD-dependent oxidoreductase [Stenotrophomonas sp. SAM-B]NWF32295.1 NAD(P)/FAD-dependent oxidoreductase [Stenotrophomonas sp. SAM-B]
MINQNSPTSQDLPHFDAVVVGGSYAGMSAALQLARACRTVLVIDQGQPRNERAEKAHGCLGWDGVAPAHILEMGRQQLLAYDRVQWATDQAITATGSLETGFAIHCASGSCYQARRLILAHGVVDQLPDIPGLAERWGETVLHCPYCHGYEICGTNIGVLIASKAEAMDQVKALSQWGAITAFHAGALTTTDVEELSRDLKAIGAALEASALVGVTEKATLRLADGSVRKMEALFVQPDSSLASDLSTRLGCAIEDAGCITTDSAKQTTIPGVFACGDAARFAGNVALAVGEGALAGVAAHRSLLGLLT